MITKHQKKKLKQSKHNFSITLDTLQQMQNNRDYKNIVNLQSIIFKKFNNDFRVLNLLGTANKENGNLDKAIHLIYH